MKNYLFLLCLVVLFACGCTSHSKDSPPKTYTEFVQDADVGAPVTITTTVDDTTPALDPATAPVNPIDFVKNNFAVLAVGLLAFLKVIVNLTPTEKDNKIFTLVDNFINWIIPNFKTGGGTHT